MRQKLRDDRGETLVEVMASVVVAALSVVLLFGAVTASVQAGKSARRMDEEYYAALSAAEAQTVPMQEEPSGTVLVKYRQNGVETSLFVTVDFYGGRGAVSYALPPGGSGP